MVSKASLLRLGLKCNPFKENLAESAINDPCRLVIVGRYHRYVLDSIVTKLINWNEPSWVFVLTGPWGVGKTAIAQRAICDARRELGVDGLLDITIFMNELPKQDFAALIVETVRRIYCRAASKRRLKQTIDEMLFELGSYPTLLQYFEDIKNEGKDPCTEFNPLIRKVTLEKIKDCNYMNDFVNEAVQFITHVSAEARAPVYIIYDQFERLIRNENRDVCFDLISFKFKFIKELLHHTIAGYKKGYKTKVVIVEAILSNVMSRFISEFVRRGVKPATMLGNYNAYDLTPFSNVTDTKDLIESYLLQSGCHVGGNSLYPFSIEAINELHKWSRGFPREIINLAGRVIEKFAQEGKQPPIPPNYVVSVAVAEELGEAAIQCLGKEDHILRESRVYDQINILLWNIFKLYTELINASTKDEGTEPYMNYRIRPSNPYNVNYLIVEYPKGVTVVGAVRRVINREHMRRFVNVVESIANKKGNMKYRRIVVLTFGGLSRPAHQVKAEAEERGIDIDVINIENDALAKLAAACVTYYANNIEEAKLKLSMGTLYRMINSGFRLIPIHDEG